MALLVYMTAASADEAERIAGDLVESRLAACVNVMAPIPLDILVEGRALPFRRDPLHRQDGRRSF